MTGGQGGSEAKGGKLSGCKWLQVINQLFGSNTIPTSTPSPTLTPTPHAFLHLCLIHVIHMPTLLMLDLISWISDPKSDPCCCNSFMHSQRASIQIAQLCLPQVWQTVCRLLNWIRLGAWSWSWWWWWSWNLS